MTPQFWYYRIGATRARVTVGEELGEPSPVAVELYDSATGRFTVAVGLLQRINSTDAVRITEAEFYGS